MSRKGRRNFKSILATLFNRNHRPEKGGGGGGGLKVKKGIGRTANSDSQSKRGAAGLVNI